MQLADILLNNLAARPDAPYIVTEDRIISCRQAIHIINRLREKHLREQAAVALNIQQPVLLCLSIWACLLENKSILLLPALADEESIQHYLHVAACTKLLSDMPLELPGMISISNNDLEEAPAPEHRDEHTAHPAEAEAAISFLSSGTTARPKLISISYRQVTDALSCIAQHGLMPYTHDQCVFISVSLFHSYGFSSLLEYTMGGSAIALPADRTFIGPVKALLHQQIRERVTAIEGVPYYYRQIAPVAGRYDWKHVRHIGFGGDFIDAQLTGDLQPVFPSAGCSVRYGVSEIPSVISLKRYDSLSFNSFPCAGAVLPIYQVTLPEEGTIIVNTHHKSIHTGDIGYIKEGELYISGRESSFIKHRGYRIFPTGIEQAACGWEPVQEAVLQQHNNKLILKVLAAEPWDPEPFREYLRRQLPSYMLPDLVERVDNIVRTDNGKIIRNPYLQTDP